MTALRTYLVTFCPGDWRDGAAFERRVVQASSPAAAKATVAAEFGRKRLFAGSTAEPVTYGARSK